MVKITFVIAATRRKIPSGQDGPMLPARVANQSAEFILPARQAIR